MVVAVYPVDHSQESSQVQDLGDDDGVDVGDDDGDDDVLPEDISSEAQFIKENYSFLK
jgi:hypothetical protein